jgi:DNA-binding MarR family transcriptional regulator
MEDLIEYRRHMDAVHNGENVANPSWIFFDDPPPPDECNHSEDFEDSRMIILRSLLGLLLPEHKKGLNRASLRVCGLRCLLLAWSLKRYDVEHMSMEQLAQIAGCTRAAISHVVRRLEDTGLVPHSRAQKSAASVEVYRRSRLEIVAQKKARDAQLKADTRTRKLALRKGEVERRLRSVNRILNKILRSEGATKADLKTALQQVHLHPPQLKGMKRPRKFHQLQFKNL